MCDLGVPQPFEGSPEERISNYRSHHWDADEDARCYDCDCKAGSVTSFWPCGTEPPRVRFQAGPSVTVASYRLIDEIAESEEREP